MTDEEFAELKINTYNAEEGHLTGYDCPICKNKGLIMVSDGDGGTKLKECSCAPKRRSVKYLERSGLASVLDAYSWDTWECVYPWQRFAMQDAKSYAANPKGWFLASGRPGTGKTHLCTAICGELLNQGREVRYLLWRDFTNQAKALITDDEAYRDLVDPFKQVSVLYLDDFFKTGKGQEPTTGDCNLAFELINARYADPRKVTLISTELSMNRLLEIDEAIGSRIYERSKDHFLDLRDKENWRVRDV